MAWCFRSRWKTGSAVLFPVLNNFARSIHRLSSLCWCRMTGPYNVRMVLMKSAWYVVRLDLSNVSGAFPSVRERANMYIERNSYTTKKNEPNLMLTVHDFHRLGVNVSRETWPWPMPQFMVMATFWPTEDCLACNKTSTYRAHGWTYLAENGAWTKFPA